MFKLSASKLIFRYTGPPAWHFTNSKIKISQLKKRPFNIFKIALDLLAYFTLDFIFDLISHFLILLSC